MVPPKKTAGFGAKPPATKRHEVVKILKPCAAKPEELGQSLCGPASKGTEPAAKSEPLSWPYRAFTELEVRRRDKRLDRIDLKSLGYSWEALRNTTAATVDYPDGPCCIYALLHIEAGDLYAKKEWLGHHMKALLNNQEALKQLLERAVDDEERSSRETQLRRSTTKLRTASYHNTMLKALLDDSKEAMQEYIDLARPQLDAYAKLAEDKKLADKKLRAAETELSKNREQLEESEQVVRGLLAQLSEYRAVGIVTPESRAGFAAVGGKGGPRPLKDLLQELREQGEEACLAAWSGYDIATVMPYLKESVALRREELIEQERADEAALDAMRADLSDLLGEAYALGIGYPD
jgi:hypothetical protein